MSSKRQLPKHPMLLPRHERTRPAFAELFERDPLETIRAMDDSGSDIPNQVPATPLRIKRVGVKRQSIPVAINDPFGSGETVQISCSVEVMVGLRSDRRGIHVSRIGDHLAKLAGRVFLSLQDYAAQLGELVRVGQESEDFYVSVQGVLTYLESVTGVKEKSSLEHLELSATAEFAVNRTTYGNGIGFTHITACPCVQQTYRNSFPPDGIPTANSRTGGEMPLLTHSQRCHTFVTISHVNTVPTVAELLSCIDSVVIRSQNTLPRDHELLNVFRAHARAQFMEDILRDLLFGVYRLVRPRTSEGMLSIKSTSMESIHDFDLEGEIAYTLGELDRIFAE